MNEFPRLGRVTLRLLSQLPPHLRERLVFSHSRRALTIQKIVQRMLGGPATIRVRFSSGLVRGQVFECLTSEKYFLIGPDYERQLQGVVKGLLHGGYVAYDVGAHAGYWTLTFAGLCGAHGRVYAFEPSAHAFERLRRNVDLNGHQTVRLINAGVSDGEGHGRLSNDGSRSHVLVDDAAGIEIRLVTLDDFVYRDQNTAPDFIKIDVEGHGARCLAGARRLLDEAKPDLLMELHDPQEAAGALGILTERGYHVQSASDGHAFPYTVVARPETPSDRGRRSADRIPLRSLTDDVHRVHAMNGS